MQVSRGSAHIVLPVAIVSAPPLPPPPPGPGDTAVIHGPRRYDAAIGSSNTIQNFVDTIPVVLNPYHRYVIRVKNGNPDGTQRVLRALVAGTDSITGSVAQKAIEIAVKPTTLITVAIRGQASAGHLTIELLEINGGNYTMFHEVFSRTNTNSDVVFTRTFTRQTNVGAPFFVWIINGNSNGTSRLANVTVRINNDTVIGLAPRPNLTTSTAVLMVKVSPVLGSNTLVVTLPKKQAGFIDLLISATDITPPALKIISPQPNLLTRLDSVNIVGTMTDPSPSQVSVNGIVRTVSADTFRFNYGLPHVDGPHLITFTAVDAAGNRVDSTRTVRVDRTPPTLTITAPPNGFITNQTTIGISYTGSDASFMSFYLNGQLANGCGGGTCGFTIFPALVEGPNSFGLMAVDSAGNTSTTQMRLGTRDTQRPTLTVSAPADSTTVSAPTVTVTGTASDAMLKDVKVNGVATTVTNGAFSKDVSLTVGQNTIVVIATDSATNADTVRRTVTRSTLPPDPATVATAIDPTVATNIATSTSFLYTGADPIQTGVAPGTIEPVRAAVVRGKVLTRDGQPLPGVRIAVLGHQEYGQTLSRADGGYDLALNGGGQLTLTYALNGYLGAQRQSNVPWQDFVVMDDTRLVASDPQVTTISFTQPIEIARGRAVTDERGTRQTTLLFAQGTHATMLLPDSSLDTLSTIHVRATEFTVGPNGPEAMPAPLPPTSAYTWAADLSADEAVSVNARAILFDKPVVVYLENFIGFPVGLPVPLGIYDTEKGAWNPIPNGRVIQIVDTPGGIARIALDSSGQPASDSALLALGVTTAERTSLASLYTAGQKLWRMPTTHFSYVDGNWPVGPDTTKEAPHQPQPDQDKKQDDPCEQKRSIIECENRVLGERIALTGSASALNYRTAGVPGRIASRQMTVPLTGPVLPDGLRQVRLDIEIAGRRFHYEFAVTTGTLTTNLRQTFTWDGKDAYNRTVNGAQRAQVTIAYRYLPLYAVPADEAASFGLTCFGPIGIASFQQCQLPNLRLPDGYFTERRQQHITTLGELTPSGVAGWTLDRQHSYDPYARTLYLGSGVRRTAGSVNAVINTVAGNGTSGSGGDGGPATEASVTPDAAAVAADGSLLIADQASNRVRRVALDGTITTVVGNGSQAYSGDGGPAVSAGIDPSDVKVGPDGSLYIADNVNHRIRRVGPDGIISTVAGSPTPNCDSQGAGDGGPATATGLCFPYSIAVGADGSFYIADTWRVRRVDPTGIIMTVAGIGRFCNTSNPDDGPTCGDGRMAVRAPLNFIESIEVDRAGNLYIVDDVANVIRRVSVEGVITTVAGTWFASGFAGDGGPALQATLRTLDGIAMADDGGFYISDRGRIRRVTSAGIIYTVAGGSETAFAGDRGPALQAQLNTPFGTRLAVGPDGAYYIVEKFSRRVRRVAPALPGFTDTQYAIVSEDGSEVYQFDKLGRHIRTLDALSAAVVDTFVYDPTGRLLRIFNRNNDTIRVERDGIGAPTAIVAPFGQRTTLSVGADGYLSTITDPAGGTFGSTYSTGGLLASLTDPRGHRSAFSYDSLGRLVSDSDAVGSVVHLANVRTDSVKEVTFTSALGRITTYRVEQTSTGATRQVTSPTGLVTTVVSDSAGRSTLLTPSGESLRMSVGPDPRWGMQARIVDSATLRTPSGLSTTVETRRHAVVTNQEDPLSLTSQIDSVGVNGNWRVATFDALSRAVVQTTPEGRQFRATLDSLGRVLSAQTTGLEPVQFRYDDRGRLTQRQNADRVTSYEYASASGLLSSVTDPLGRRTLFSYDSAGRVTTQTLPNGRTIQFGYDATGNLTSLSPPGRPAHTFQYTSVNRTQQYDPPGIPDPTSTRYFYNLDRQLDSLLRPDSVTIAFGYDPGGRTRTVRFDRGTLTYGYSSTTGNLEAIRTPTNDSLVFSYDGSLPTAVRWTGTVTGSVEVSYNNELRVVSRTVNGTDGVSFQYDRDGLLTAAGGLQMIRSPTTGVLLADTLGLVGTAYNHTSRGELAGSHAAANGVVLLARGYQRDSVGRMTRLADTTDGVATDWRFVFDSIGRLLTDSMNGAPFHSFTYDVNGNRLSYTSSAGTINYSYDAQDRLLSAGTTAYTYGSNGELRTKTVPGVGTTSYTYDALGNLVTVVLPSGTRIDYVVDGQNRRVGRKVNGVLVQAWLYQDQLNPIAELDGNGNVVSRFVYATHRNRLAYLIKGGTIYRVLVDHIGSVRLVVDATTGAVVQRIDYDEWGNVLANTNPGFQPLSFAGGITDDSTKLVRFGARDYDPSLGRWVGKDPIGFRGSETNLYVYASNDPGNTVDPTGLQVVCTWEQSSGSLLCDNWTTGEDGVVDAGGWAGQGEGFNNPFAEGQKGIGPLPQGFYDLGQPEHTHLGNPSFPLIPWPETRDYIESLGRDPDSFILHAWNPKRLLLSSEGCPIVSLQSRLELASELEKAGGVGILVVVPGPDEPNQ